MESRCVKGLLLDDLVEELPGVLTLWQVLPFIDQSSVVLVGEGQELLLESRTPWDPVLFLFLDVFQRHVSGVIKQLYEALHHALTVVARHHAVVLMDLLVFQLAPAQHLPRLHVEELPRLVVLLAYLMQPGPARVLEQVVVTGAHIHERDHRLLRLHLSALRHSTLIEQTEINFEFKDNFISYLSNLSKVS